MNRAEYTVSSKNALRYIAAALVLVSVFFTLFVIEPYYSTDYMAHSILPQENAPDSIRLWFRYAEGISVSAVMLLTGEVSFILLCLSSFINKRPWLLALPMAVIALAHGMSIGALVELALVALFVLTAVGMIRTKIPALIIFGLHTSIYVGMTVAFNVQSGGDELIITLMWLAVLLVVIAMKKNTQA